jgi:hypothetical protein
MDGGTPLLAYPHPISAKKYFIFKKIERGFRCKILSAKELSADSSKQRSYGGVFGRSPVLEEDHGTILRQWMEIIGKAPPAGGSR